MSSQIFSCNECLHTKEKFLANFNVVFKAADPWETRFLPFDCSWKSARNLTETYKIFLSTLNTYITAALESVPIEDNNRALNAEKTSAYIQSVYRKLPKLDLQINKQYCNLFHMLLRKGCKNSNATSDSPNSSPTDYLLLK